ncbi:MAG TPA: dephospho-CoA kinase, partial [Desulfobacteraceae bacterium]|nr:dephospho-CoA kinase [Desulfobacteraceae bacterium]
MSKTILKIGVTGSAGSGKSLFCRRFKALGLVTLDCDRIARQIVEPGQPAFDEVVARFGDGVVGPDGGLDRAGLRRIIVAQPDRRQQLERILHPGIIAEMVRQMEEGDYTKEAA